MKVKLLVGALVVLVIINIAALGSFWFMYRQGPPGRGDERPGREYRMQRGAGRDLSGDERRRLRRAVRSFRQDVRPLIEQTGTLESDLIASMKKDPVPRAHIDSLLEAISQNRLEISRRATDRMIAMGDSLSPDERERMMNTLMQFRRGQFGRDGDGKRWRRGN